MVRMMVYFSKKKKEKRMRRLDKINSEKRKEKRTRRLEKINSEKRKEKRMRRSDRIISVLPDELIMKIFRHLELKQDQEAFSLVCKRWLNLGRLSCGGIFIRFTDGTDTLLKFLTEQYANVRNVSIDELPEDFIAPNPKHIRVGTRLINQFPYVNGFSSISRSKLNELRKYGLSDSGLATVGKGFTKLESLKLNCCSNVTDAGLISMAEKCNLLKSLDLKQCCAGDKSLVAIGKCCTRLEVLNLENCDSLTDVGLAQFAIHCGRTLMSLGIRKCRGLTNVTLEAVGSHCTSLRTLSIVSESINDKGLVCIANGCSLLKSLIIECENITDDALQAIGGFCLPLELLALYHCSKLTDRSLYAIGKGCKKLKTLSLGRCHHLSELGLDSIALGCAELIRLEVDCCFSMGTTGLKSIGHLACIHLSELVLKNLNFHQLDNDALREIGTGCKHLQSLHLIHCLGIWRETFSGITSGCRNLKKLNISGCEVGYGEMIFIGENCKFLTELRLDSCYRIDDYVIRAIAGAWPDLNCLSLSGLKDLRDEGMAAVSRGCPFLKDLVISGCKNLTDAGLDYIAKKCKLLESCCMMSCPKITKFGVKVFVMRCQKLKKIGVEHWKLGYMDMDSIGPRL